MNQPKNDFIKCLLTQTYNPVDLNKYIIHACDLIKKQGLISSENNEQWLELIANVNNMEYEVQYIHEVTKIIFFFQMVHINDTFRQEIVEHLTKFANKKFNIKFFVTGLHDVCNKNFYSEINNSEFILSMMQLYNKSSKL